MTSPHPRKRPQRRSEIPHGPQQDTGLQQIRDALPPVPAPCTVKPAPRPVGDEVPPELLQRQDFDADLLRRYLQSPDPDRYITHEAVQHLDGLTGAVPEEAAEPVWTVIGRHVARDGS
ncbi:hypothetical protein [Streptomyces bungoensis]|uniref:hypothetical protein n=1 Tax=Streptomyces bungoensis TaxID=285568 RepID=UPI0033EEF102